MSKNIAIIYKIGILAQQLLKVIDPSGVKTGRKKDSAQAVQQQGVLITHSNFNIHYTILLYYTNIVIKLYNHSYTNLNYLPELH